MDDVNGFLAYQVLPLKPDEKYYLCYQYLYRLFLHQLNYLYSVLAIPYILFLFVQKCRIF